MAFENWSTTASLNVLANTGINWDEGQLPSTVNNSARDVMAALATALGNYPGVGYKNKLINGDFEVWQRGAGGSASIAVAASTTAYTADRWYITTGANQASVVSQQTGLTNGSRFCARVQRNSGQTGTAQMSFSTPLTTDMVVALRGTKIAISARVRSGANWSPTSGNLTMSLYVGTGANGKRAGGFTGETTVATVTTALGTSSAVTLMSAASAAVVPTTATQGELQFAWTPTGTAGTNDYIELDEVQDELGSVPSPFERRLFGHELMLCQRFYEKSFAYTSAPVQAIGGASDSLVYYLPTGASGTFGAQILYRVPKRAISGAVTYNPISSNANWRDLSNSADRVVTIVTQSTTQLELIGAAGVAGSANYIHWAVDADL